MNWYLEVMRKYAVFTGRARRKEYWMFQLMNIILISVLAFTFALLIPSMTTHRRDSFAVFVLILLLAYILATLIPGLAVSVRRLHDTNVSGWWMLIGFIPLGGLVLFVLHVLDSNPGPNQYGPNPKGGGLPAHASQYAPYATQAMMNAVSAGTAAATGHYFLGICNACGTPMQAGTRFCPKCGKPAY